MHTQPSVEKRQRSVFKTVIFFIIVLCLSAILIVFGRRNDAVTMAERYQAGVLTADEVNVAFENVGGKLLKRFVLESDRVVKGQLLMRLDDQDTLIAIKSAKAGIDAIKAQLASQKNAIAISLDKLETLKIKTWRNIEQVKSSLNGAQAAYDHALAEYRRYKSLNNSSSVSKSAYDEALKVYLQAKAQKNLLEQNLKELTLGASSEQLEKLLRTGSAEGMSLKELEEQKREILNLENTVEQLNSDRRSQEAQLDQLKLNLKRSRLYAPASGKVLKLFYQEGEMVSSNAAAVLIETNRQYYDVYISEKKSNLFHPGDRVLGNVPALGIKLLGTVRFVQNAPSFTDLRMSREQGQADLASFQMRIYTDPEPKVLPGMTVEILNE